MTGEPSGRGGGIVVAGGAVGTARAASLLLAALQLPLVARLVPADQVATVPASVQLAGVVGLVVADPAVLAFQRHPGSATDRRGYRWALRRVLLGLTAGSLGTLSVGLAAGVTPLALGVAGWMLGVTLNRLSAIAWLMWGREWRCTASVLAGTATRTAVLLGALAAGLSAPLSLATAGLASAGVALLAAPRGRDRVAAPGGHPREGAAGSAGPGGPPGLEGPAAPTLRLGAGLAVGQLGLQVLGTAPLLVATALLGAATTGPLGVATQVAALVGTALNLVTTVAYPRLRERWDSGRRGEATATARLLVGSALALGAGSAAVLVVGDAALLRLALPAELVEPRLVVAAIAASSLSTTGLVASWSHQFALRTGVVVRRSLASAAVAVALVVGGTVVDGTTGAVVGGLLGLAGYAGAMLRGSGVATAGTVAAVAVLAVGGTVGALVERAGGTAGAGVTIVVAAGAAWGVAAGARRGRCGRATGARRAT